MFFFESTIHISITATGEVYSWGLGSSGQLGHNDSVNLDTPKKIETFPNGHSQIYSVFCASAQSAAITESGDLYLWGWKGRENVDIPQHISLPAPVIAVGLGGFHVIALVDQEDGPKVFTWGQGAKGQLGYDTQNTQYQPRIVEDLLPFYITQIAAGETHSAALNGTFIKKLQNPAEPNVCF
jgi:alpha-tubulin suppressor-like RCC1 family protein